MLLTLNRIPVLFFNLLPYLDYRCIIHLLKTRTNEEWINELILPSPYCDNSISDLRLIIKKSLKFVLLKKSFPEEYFLEDVTQEAVLKIIDRLKTFKGNSSFITWANKVAVRLVLDEIRKRQWKDISLDDLSFSRKLVYAGDFIDNSDGPEKAALKKNIVSVVNSVMSKELSVRQRKVLQAIQIHRMPIREVARRIGVDRNTLYKSIHDARKKLKKSLLEKGIGAEDISELFN